MIKRCAATAVALLLCACNPQAPKGVASPQPSPSPSASAPVALNVNASGTATKPVRFVSQKGNGKQYEILARSFVSHGAPGSAKGTFATPHVTFYGKDGSTLIADAARATVDQSANVVTLSGNVVAHNSSGMGLTCDTLTYDRARSTFHGEGHVVVTQNNGFHATGSRLDSDITLTHTQLQ